MSRGQSDDTRWKLCVHLDVLAWKKKGKRKRKKKRKKEGTAQFLKQSLCVMMFKRWCSVNYAASAQRFAPWGALMCITRQSSEYRWRTQVNIEGNDCMYRSTEPRNDSVTVDEGLKSPAPCRTNSFQVVLKLFSRSVFFFFAALILATRCFLISRRGPLSCIKLSLGEM